MDGNESKRAEFGRWRIAASRSRKPSSIGDYRISHAMAGAGADYNKTYDEGYYAALWTKIERSLLEEILREMAGQRTKRTKCLDFACGTGRITSVAAQYFTEVVGVDISAAMLACARVPGNVRLRQIDITRESLGETFDVVTAFRFFLNAEQRLRTEALAVIREHLNDAGRLICNIQMNATSPIGIASRLANRLSLSSERNSMSIDELNSLLISGGFAIERVAAYGYLPRPGNLLPQTCETFIEPVERFARAIGIPARFAQQFLVVARKA